MKCVNCGAEITPNDEHCTHCGTQLQKEETAPTPEPKKSSSNVIPMVIAVIMVMVVIISIFTLSSLQQADDGEDDNGDDQTTPQPERCTIDYGVQNEQLHTVLGGDSGKIVYFPSPSSVQIINGGFNGQPSTTEEEYADIVLEINEDENYIRYSGTIYYITGTHGEEYTYRIWIRAEDSSGVIVEALSQAWNP